MQLSERNVNGVTIIDVHGDFAFPTENSRALREKVGELLQRGERLILLNVGDVKHADSSFLADIVEAYKAATSRGAVLKLERVDRHLRGVLQTTALDSILKSYDAEEEALASF